MPPTLQNNRFAPLVSRELAELAEEMQRYREYEPLHSTGGGKYSGHILGFVKGLRISAKLIYFLRKCLSTERVEVSWGHIIDENTGACSPECDVIIHVPGFYDKWNGGEKPIMEFKFIQAQHVLGVVSCKSALATIDQDYVDAIKALGAINVIMFAECCSKTNYENLKTRAVAAGYSGLWCAYFTTNTDGEMLTDDEHHNEFWAEIKRAFHRPH